MRLELRAAAARAKGERVREERQGAVARETIGANKGGGRQALPMERVGGGGGDGGAEPRWRAARASRTKKVLAAGIEEPLRQADRMRGGLI